jgi:hypothetical protein
MKTATLAFLAILSLLVSSCTFRSHAGRNSTGAGISTSSGAGVSGAIRY